MARGHLAQLSPLRGFSRVHRPTMTGHGVPTHSQRQSRRAVLSRAAAASAGALTVSGAPHAAQAAITEDSEWPLWLALPVAPYSRKKTIRRELAPKVWAFDQMLGIYYVQVSIRFFISIHCIYLLLSVYVLCQD